VSDKPHRSKSATSHQRSTRSPENRKEYETDLIQRVVARNRAAMDELVHAYTPAVFHFSLNRLGNHHDAEDLTQEVLIRVIQNLPSFKGQSALLTWILGIAHFLVLREHHSKHRRLELVPLDQLARFSHVSDTPSPERADASRALEHCARILERDVSSHQRRIFQMMLFENSSMRSISSEMGIGPGAVKSSLRNTRRILSRHTVSR
jgi:RNA polymerase sigma-70 factor (ECF subfamily)